ncbi:CLUMA_CG007118, isoform A [Clunio marinus]|uniref:CLUMA_CG007118, isoform A n=1 Tax=Clunio marinus TaxID=568069 RepID=A0A1J1I5C6_9DIPT|nr:CLUMA_CG007118, isoform A [Clunio marinus]
MKRHSFSSTYDRFLWLRVAHNTKYANKIHILKRISLNLDNPNSYESLKRVAMNKSSELDFTIPHNQMTLWRSEMGREINITFKICNFPIDWDD